MRDYDKAISDYSEAIRLDPNNPSNYDIYYNRGLAYYHKQDYDNAISDYDEAIRINPGCGDAYYNRGLVYRQLGKASRAQADFKKAKEVGYKPQ